MVRRQAPMGNPGEALAAHTSASDPPVVSPLPWIPPCSSPFLASLTCGAGAMSLLKMSCPSRWAVLAGLTTRVGEAVSAPSEKTVLASICFFPSETTTVRRKVGVWAGASSPKTIWEAPPGGRLMREDGLWEGSGRESEQGGFYQSVRL